MRYLLPYSKKYIQQRSRSLRAELSASNYSICTQFLFSYRFWLLQYISTEISPTFTAWFLLNFLLVPLLLLFYNSYLFLVFGQSFFTFFLLLVRFFSIFSIMGLPLCWLIGIFVVRSFEGSLVITKLTNSLTLWKRKRMNMVELCCCTRSMCN